MMRWLGLWLLRILVAFAAITLVAYAVDWTVYHVRGSPQSTVAVSRLLAIPLKGEKTEYDYLGTNNVPCAVALFPQGSEDPCWYLRRHHNQSENAGAPAY
jgi:hypothetical protein